MTFTVQSGVYLGLFLFFQSILVFWSFRRDAPGLHVFLVALLPFVGVPLVLYRNRGRIHDNHVAGALTYLILMATTFAFILWYPKAMEDDIPWALIHTMQFFGFLGLANLVMAPFRR